MDFEQEAAREKLVDFLGYLNDLKTRALHQAPGVVDSLLKERVRYISQSEQRQYENLEEKEAAYLRNYFDSLADRGLAAKIISSGDSTLYHINQALYGKDATVVLSGPVLFTIGDTKVLGKLQRRIRGHINIRLLQSLKGQSGIPNMGWGHGDSDDESEN